MYADNKASPWWSEARYADVKPFLTARGAITRAVRAWFDEQGFVEVETAILQVSPGNEIHLHAAYRACGRRRPSRAALFADFAGICLQEVAGGGRNEDFRVCTGV